MPSTNYDLDVRVVESIRDLLEGCRSRNDVDGTAWNAARLSITGLFRTAGARQVSEDQLVGIITVVRGSRSFTMDENIARRFGDLRRGLLDDLLELREH